MKHLQIPTRRADREQLPLPCPRPGRRPAIAPPADRSSMVRHPRSRLHRVDDLCVDPARGFCPRSGHSPAAVADRGDRGNVCGPRCGRGRGPRDAASTRPCGATVGEETHHHPRRQRNPSHRRGGETRSHQGFPRSPGLTETTISWCTRGNGPRPRAQVALRSTAPCTMYRSRRVPR